MSVIFSAAFSKQYRTFPQKEQKIISHTIMDLNIDPTVSTLSLHKLDGNAGWWSAYVNGDIRIIFHRGDDGQMVLCWVDHHDRAYVWAKNHVLKEHPATGKMQLVEIPEIVAEPKIEMSQKDETSKRPLCDRLAITRDELLGWGVPEEWVERVMAATEEEELLNIGQHHLPPEAADAVLSIAVGERPAVEPEETVNGGEPKWNPQSWWVVSKDDDLKSILENADWDAWCVYLHPSQRKVAYRKYDKPFRVSGSAGTGKTVVALHHAKFVLGDDAESRVLISTYSPELAADLKRRCCALLSPRALERCDVTTLYQFARKQFDMVVPGHEAILSHQDANSEALKIIERHEDELPKGITPAFALSEWRLVVEPRQIHTEEEYLRTVRRGVHTRLSPERRKALWKVLGYVYDGLNRIDGNLTVEQMYARLAEYYRTHPEMPRYYTNIIVDECQDLCEIELDFLMAYLSNQGNVFFAGDIGQRIIRYSFPWRPHGVDLRGRSRVLKVNYRTTHEIRSMADRLTDLNEKDADGNEEKRRSISLLSGPKPEIKQYENEQEEIDGVADWLNHLANDLHVPSDAVAIFYRSENERPRAEAALERSVYNFELVKPKVLEMFQAKGLEYRAAVVMACDSGVIPSPERIAEADLVAGIEEIYNTERNLLYVACTRARDYLLVTSAGIPSELLLDMRKM